MAQNPSGFVNVLSWSELAMHLYLVSHKTEESILQDSQIIEWLMMPNPPVEIKAVYVSVGIKTLYIAPGVEAQTCGSNMGHTLRACLVWKLDKIIYPPLTYNTTKA